MITKEYFNLDINSKDFEKDFEVILLSNSYKLVFKWTRNKKIALLDCILKHGRGTIYLINQPLTNSNGTITINLGQMPDTNFRIYYTVYAVEAVPKMKVFVVDSTDKKVIRKKPATTTKKLKKTDIWRDRI